MLDFIQWVTKEYGEDTGIQIYPPSYLVGQYPSLALAGGSSDAGFWLTTVHKDDAHFESGAKDKKKKRHKKSEKKKDKK